MSEQKFERAPATFEMLYEAVTATPRGRWFLEEFAKRNRAADTEQVLVELARLNEARSGTAQDKWVHSLQLEVEALHRIIDAARADFATIKPNDDDASADFAALVSAIDATSRDVRAAAVQLLEAVKQLREMGPAQELSVEIEDLAASLLLTASMEDISGRRAKAMVAALSGLEKRLAALRGRLGPVDDPDHERTSYADHTRGKPKHTGAKDGQGIESAGRKREAKASQAKAQADSNVFPLSRDDETSDDVDLDGEFSQDRLDALLR